MSKKGAPQIILDVGFDFSWDEKKVWALDVPIEEMPIEELVWHFDIPFWEKEDTDDWNLMPWDVINHPGKEPWHHRRVMEADTSFPLDIMWNKGRWLLLDGLHRLVKLYQNGEKTAKVRKIPREYIDAIKSED